MSADLLTLLDQLDEARAKATPGEWTADSHEIYQEWPGIRGMSGEWIGETCRVEGDPLHSTSDADAALIVAAVNALPMLTAALRNVLLFAETIDGHDMRATSTAALIRKGITEALGGAA